MHKQGSRQRELRHVLARTWTCPTQAGYQDSVWKCAARGMHLQNRGGRRGSAAHTLLNQYICNAKQFLSSPNDARQARSQAGIGRRPSGIWGAPFGLESELGSQFLQPSHLHALVHLTPA